MPREYLPTLIIAVIWTIIFVWFRIFELPRIRRERREPTEAPESHSKSAE